MTKIEKYAISLVKELVPNFSKMEFTASVGDTSRSIEFFVLIDGERKQCYELIDSGDIDELKMEKLFDTFALKFRENADYKKGGVNKIKFESGNIFDNVPQN